MAGVRLPPATWRLLPPPLNSVWLRRLLQLLAVLRFFRVPQLAYAVGLRASAAARIALRVWRVLRRLAPGDNSILARASSSQAPSR